MYRSICLFLIVVWARPTLAIDLPQFPTKDGAVEIPVQEWPQRPGPRTVRVLVHFPGGSVDGVSEKTGIILTLHNWGGTDCVGTADPRELARSLNVVAICVNYLQSGKHDSIDGPEPYDFGHLQALDTLRALWFTRQGLKSANKHYDDARLFCTGGSGGGNVTLMANKLAPRTFACVVDLCGMKKLSDDIAFNLPGGSSLDARWSRDPASRNHLTLDEQELRFVAHPGHLAEMKRLGTASRIVVVHGVEDTTCPFKDAVQMVDLMKSAKLDVEPKWVSKDDLDGKVFTSAGHSLGDRTKIVQTVAGKYLAPDGSDSRRRNGATDFDRGEVIRYRTDRGEFLIDYSAGYPVSVFEKSPDFVFYQDHQDLLYSLDRDGRRHAVKTVDDWLKRRHHIQEGFQRVTGRVPSPLHRVDSRLEIREETQIASPATRRSLIRRKVIFRSDENHGVPAYVFVPREESANGASNDTKRPAVLCLQQTTTVGKDEPAGLRGDPSMKYALELAERGFVTFAPDYPSFGEHPFDFSEKRGYQSGTMKAIWDNMRAVDVLEAMPEVDGERIGCIGHSLGGHNAIFTAALEPRIKVIVASCGFTSLRKDDLPSWTVPRYMPLIETSFSNDINRLPFDFHELIGSLAPRPFFAIAATKDDDFDVSGVRDVMQSARPVYELHGAADALKASYPDVPHSFPEVARNSAYEFLERHLSAASPRER